MNLLVDGDDVMHDLVLVGVTLDNGRDVLVDLDRHQKVISRAQPVS